jgi:hypothetical protein
MKKIAVILGSIFILSIMSSFSIQEKMKSQSIYNVVKLKQSMKIDANWEKPQWKSTEALEINNFMGDKPPFSPSVQAKMLYDDKNIYVIFHVKDRNVRCITKDINGPVWEDSAVEFFFSPDTSFPLKYFNLEINCGGTPLMHYNVIPREEFKNLDIEDIKQIEIAHSLPQIVDPEIKEQITWTLEYRIPLALLRKYSNVTQPKPGITWKGNLYKIAENTSNHHYMTWALIENSKPDFHLPQYFGILRFE